MMRVRSILLFLPLLVLATGCSQTTAPTANNVDASGQPVSAVPWNKPESWETNGQLGGMSQ